MTDKERNQKPDESEPTAQPTRARATYLGVPQVFNLNLACAALVEAYGPCVYLVGSSLERRDYRDVDVRCLLNDETFVRLFPAEAKPTHWNSRLALMNAALSEWLAKRCDLPIDFQFQAQSEANRLFSGPRSALGLFYEKARRAKEQADG